MTHEQKRPLHLHTHVPAALPFLLLIRAHVKSKHALILGKLFPAVLSPSCSSASLRPCLLPLFPPLLASITWLRPEVLNRKWAAGDDVCRTYRVALDLLRHFHENSKVFDFNLGYRGDGSCACPAGTPLTPPPWTWWVMSPGRTEHLPVRGGSDIIIWGFNLVKGLE